MGGACRDASCHDYDPLICMTTAHLGLVLRMANLADCFFTVLVYLSVGSAEWNPVMGWLLAFSVPLFVAVKLVGVAVLSAILVAFEKRKTLVALSVLLIAAAAANAAVLL